MRSEDVDGPSLALPVGDGRRLTHEEFNECLAGAYAASPGVATVVGPHPPPE